MNSKKSSNYYVTLPPNDFSNPNNSISFFSRQAIRAGYSSPDLIWRRDYYVNPNPNFNFRDSFQRELEKDIIREEIIAEELFRRRLLEEEVRREMMMEREMAMRRGGGELRFGSTMRVQFQHRERITPLLTDFEHRETGFCEPRTLPFQRDPVVAGSGSGNVLSSCVRLKEIKEIRGPAIGVNKDEGVFVSKPNATDLKRKATTPPNVSLGDPSTGLKKPKSMDDWSCALCQVTATSERALNDHLQGKKHKSRESGLCSQRTGFGTGPLPKTESYNLAKPIKVPGATNSPSLEKKREGAGESLLGKVDKSASLELRVNNQKSNHMKELETCVAKRKLGESSGPLKPANSKLKNSKPKKKFKFSCELCNVQTYRLKEMKIHKKGKRHLAKFREADKTKEISSEKSMVEEKKGSMESDMACFLEKGVVEEEKEMDISVANSCLEKGVVEEEKGMHANEPNIKKEVDEVESRKEGNDYDENHKMKVLEIDSDLVDQEYHSQLM